MKKATLPILHETDIYTPSYFNEDEKVTCYQSEEKKWIWIDDNGDKYFREKCMKRFCFKPIKGE